MIKFGNDLDHCLETGGFFLEDYQCTNKHCYIGGAGPWRSVLS